MVAAIDHSRRCITLADGQELTFEVLVFATGTAAKQPPLPGLELPGVFYLRHIDDVVRLRALRCARRVVIVGAGYIGLEVAATLVTEGRQVTILEAQDRVLNRVTGTEVSAFYDRSIVGAGLISGWRHRWPRSREKIA